MRNFPTQYNLQADDVLYFCHIPKTAGMTFRTIVEDQFHCSDVCPATLNAQLAKMSPEEIQSYRLFRGHLGFINLPELLPGKQVINVTVLREPVARVISHYEYIRRMPGDPHYEAVKDMTLEEFAQKLTAGKVGKNIQTYHVAKTAQFSLESLSPQETLDLAKASLDDFAFVGLVERFQDSLFLLSYIFGWKPIFNSRKENAAGKQKVVQEIPASTLEVIQANTRLDDVLYRHAKEIFEVRFAAMQRDLIDRFGAEVVPELVDQPDPQLSSEQLATLLEKHYDQRYRELHPKPPKVALYDFCQPLRGTGWQRREYFNQDPLAYRWIGPTPSATLDIPFDTSTDAYLEFQMVGLTVTLPELIKTLKLEVNQQPLPYDLLFSNEGRQILRAYVPQSVLQSQRPFTNIQFEVSRTISLNSINPLNPDTRLVGLAFNVVQLLPAAKVTELSIVAPQFRFAPWQETVAFMRQQAPPEEPVVAPTVFRIQLPNPITDYKTFLKKGGFPWLILHKGMVETVDTVLFKLIGQGFAPVYANEVFVIFSTHRHLPKLPYTSPHVKPLYVDYLKRQLAKVTKPIWRRVVSSGQKNQGQTKAQPKLNAK
ncbi:sulfotransferase family 2 domain-containing protein [Leptolyngbya sp. NK1-12]|uniref:Sulfotransferase family 2 domain-containing protein n=1 Tax=Leptolyngbya sp. NK1-12 TaxID=2547451 RepID=A0AA96WMU7_9CYAN|nr:sulfotransferase family 2 domain-containing protein [Leptolyngbya sp. NK1-12]